MNNKNSFNSYNSLIDMIKHSWSVNSNEIAIDTGVDQMTYKELEVRVTQLSEVIVAVAPTEEIIALTTSRGIQLIVNILAILHAGKTYLPIDSNFPEARIKQIVEDCGVKYYLKSNENDSLDLKCIDVNSKGDEVNQLPAIRTDRAYILYTSGSTGKPKGVCVSNASVINLMLWQLENSISKPGIKTLQFTRLTFDISVQEIFSTLYSGGILQIVEADILRDNQALIDALNTHKVHRIFLPFVALQGIANEAENSSVFPEHLLEVMTCGEQLKSTRAVKALFSNMKDARLFNQYGPTECTCIVTQLELPKDTATWDDLPTIGKAISGVESLILNEDLKEITEPHVEGEIYFAGKCLAEGYLNKEELTKQSFFPIVRENGQSLLVYKTGDLGYYTENQEIFFLGRMDDQVKVSGFRIETGEIETVAAELPGVDQVAIVVREYEDGQKYLELFYVSEDNQVSEAQMLAHLKVRLPAYMIPNSCIKKDSFSKTSNGKIDRKALLENSVKVNSFTDTFVKPRGETEERVANIWRRLLNLNQVGRDDHFFELGGSSLLAQRMAIEVNKEFGKEFTVTKIYQFPKLKDQASFLAKEKQGFHRKQFYKNKKSRYNRDVAVISTASRFPGASNNEEFWDIIKNGKETIRFFEIEELAASEQAKAKSDPNYIKARGIIEDIKEFDYEFFGVNPKLASIMDPQQRLFLEVAFEALDAIGYIANSLEYPVGVFAGCSTNYYYNRNLVFDADLEESMGFLQMNSANEKDYLPTKVAFMLDLKGPAVNINTACSTALVAVATAVQSIRSGECVAAIAGASSVAYPIHSGHRFEEGSIMSKDGHCRPFDADASGTLFSDGAGAVLLKDYEEAVKDGDPILAIIKGVGINNDGANKSSFSAPSVEGQAGAIRMALDDAGVDPSEIGYIEAHGTGTPIGDPIEIEGLNMAFGPTKENQYCAVGSVKGNIGHLNAASGIAGFLKAIFALQHKTLPKSIGYDTPNPAIDFKETPFFIQEETVDWNSESPRKAGVSSFGIGGTNCHVVLEEFIPEPVAKATVSEIDQSIYFSAKNELSLRNYAARLKQFLIQNPSQNLAQFGYNVNANNANYKLGAYVSFRTYQELVEGLEAVASGTKKTIRSKGEFNYPVFLFPGQGAQYMGMGKDLYQKEAIYRSAFDLCDKLFSEHTDFSIKGLLYSSISLEGAEDKLSNTRYTQPVIFAVSYALAKLWESKGIEPSSLAGHSIGEFVAACIAGVMSLEDAVRLVAKRGELISDLNPGSMLSIRSSAETILPLLPATVTIAADNAPNLCVASGPSEAIKEFAEELKKKEIPSKLLVTSHAFHSTMMEPALDEFAAVLNTVQLRNPKISIMSTVTGEWLKDSEATSVEYWTNHMLLPVLFNKAIANLLKEMPEAAFIEVGPGNGLSTLMIQHDDAKAFIAVQSLSRTSKDTEIDFFEAQYHSLIGQGLRLNWEEFYDESVQRKILLPAYAFDKKLCWIDVEFKAKAEAKPASTEQFLDKYLISEEEDSSGDSLVNALEQKVSQIIQEACGIALDQKDLGLSYFEIGMDSLSLTQLAFSLKKEFGLAVSFLQLNTELDSPSALVKYLHSNLKHDYLSETAITSKDNGEVKTTAKGEEHVSEDFSETVPQPELLCIAMSNQKSGCISAEQEYTSDMAKEFIQEFIDNYHALTFSSKSKSEAIQAYSSDKSSDEYLSKVRQLLNYPIEFNQREGIHLKDLDGNTYIDWFSGLGNKLFGHHVDFIQNAIVSAVGQGGAHATPGITEEVIAQKISQLTHKEETKIFESGIEASRAAIELAKSATNRNLILRLVDSDQGLQELNLESQPGSTVHLVLNYNSSTSLETISARGSEIAAILLAPVQENSLAVISEDYLKKLRRLTRDLGICLIFDEINTGFRSSGDGLQAQLGIDADLTLYGGLIGGGFSLGALAGSKIWMDRMNTLGWNSSHTGLSSLHPVTLHASNAVLDYLIAEGNALQASLSDLTNTLVIGINSIFEKYNVEFTAVNYSSIWRIKPTTSVANSEVFFAALRQNGIHIIAGLPCYTTTKHNIKDVQLTLSKMDDVLKRLVEHEVLNGDLLLASTEWMSSDDPPFEGAKISIDENGTPVWVDSDEYKKTKNILLQSFFL